MEWTKSAQEAVSKIPFFIRHRVKKRIEEEAVQSGDRMVTIDHVLTCQKKFLHRMEEEIKGYRLETCFSSAGCPNPAVNSHDLIQEIEKQLTKRDLRSFLKEKVKGPLKIHHELLVSISDCPNACSHPQIADIGLIGSRIPVVSKNTCSHCQLCVNICREKALSLPAEADAPVINDHLCLFCGQCLRVCPSGTLKESASGYRLLLGGKLGRHPQLGRQLPNIYSIEDTLRIINQVLDYYQKYNQEGERLGEIINREGMDFDRFLRR